MRYRNEQLREALAAEYALGTLQGAARRRFERSLKDDPELRRLVVLWQERLAPLDSAVEAVTPPAHVWNAIERRIGLTVRRGTLPQARGFWSSLAFWRTFSVISSAAAIVLAVVLMALPSNQTQREMMVVVMSDDSAAPHMTVSWPMNERGKPKLRIRVMQHETMEPNTSWELWMLPGGDQKPVSLGLISTDNTQDLHIPRELQNVIDRAHGLAMSIEPKGGSPTGQPTGKVLYKGLTTPL